MTRFEESRLIFKFGDSWQVIQYDAKDSDYTKGLGIIEGSHAVDFVGIHDEILYLIEVKNYHNCRIENKPKLENGELAVELAQKVRDTIAGIVGTHRIKHR